MIKRSHLFGPKTRVTFALLASLDTTKTDQAGHLYAARRSVEKAAQNHFRSVARLEQETAFEPLRSSPEWQKLLDGLRRKTAGE